MGHEGVGNRLREIVEEVGLKPLGDEALSRFGAYLGLLMRWNGRTNLSAIRDAEGILRRHFVESIGCAQMLPAGIGSLLDFGSGGGFPGVPISICRGEIEVTLAESQGKKAAFLQEAVRVLGLSAKVHAGRAEALQARFDCVTLRAVDQMATAVRTAAGLLAEEGYLALMTTREGVSIYIGNTGSSISTISTTAIPGTDQGVLWLGRRSSNA